MSNPFDKFDAAPAPKAATAKASNPFDQFDPAPRYSADDVDAIVRTTAFEERDPRAQQGVASVILNRAASRGQPARAIVTAPNQFEPWSARRAEVESLTPDSPQYQRTLANIAPVLENGPVTDATHFYAPGAQRALGRAPPRWDDGTGLDVGQSRFFTNPDEFPPAEVSAEPDLAVAQGDEGMEIDINASTNPEHLAEMAARKPRPPAVPLLDDMKSGFASPLNALKAGVHQDLERIRARASAPPPSFGETLKQSGQDMVSAARVAGDAVNLLSSPVQALVRPAARAINRVGLSPYAAPTASLSRDGVSFTAPRELEGEEAQAAQENNLNMALSGARAAPRAPAVPVRKPVDLPQIQAAKTAAYGKVDASGFAFPKAQLKTVARDIAASIKADGGADLYPDAAKMAARIQRMAGKDLPLSQVEKLRGQIYEQTMYPGSKEFKQGEMMRAKLDALIDTANNPAVREARALNTQYMKMKEVTDRLDSADLRASSTYGGGNMNNATRQNLRPLIDPKSPQRMRNLTKDETKALNRAVRGTAGQNAVRLAGKTLDPRTLIGGVLQGAMGVGTGGASIPSAFAGMAATEAGKAMTARNVQQLLDLISVGGVKPKPVPYVPAPARLLSPGGAVAVGEGNRLLLDASQERSVLGRRR